MYLLDTNVILDILKSGTNSENIKHNLKQKNTIYNKSELFFSAICYQEILVGINAGRNKHGINYKKDYFQALLNFIYENLTIINYTREAVDIYARIVNNLASKGVIVHSNDLIIASSSIENNLTLITHNTKDFKNISELKLQDWAIV